MITEFKLNETERKLAEEFERKHLKCGKEHQTTLGGYIAYTFIPNSIGTGVTVKCLICGEEENVTDYSIW